MTPVFLSEDAIDTCGTGGSGKKTLNTSTLTAFVVAAAGGKVAKHGNRSASGNCGAFDLRETLGAKINLAPDEERRIFDRLGIVFLYAPAHHQSMRLALPLRKAIGRPTLFNYLGPLVNPANVGRQLIGTGSHETALLFAECLRQTEAVQGVIATGHDGLDEVTVSTATTIRTVAGGRISETQFTPEEVHLSRFAEGDIEGGSLAENAAFFRELASGGGSEARKALLLANAAHALQLAGLSATLLDARELAAETLAAGRVLDLVERYCRLSNNLNQ